MHYNNLNNISTQIHTLMGNFLNILNIIGWTTVVSLTFYNFLQNPVLFFRTDITLQVGLLTVVQTFQILDILMIIIGKSKGSLLGSVAQITGRLVVAWVFVETETSRKWFAFMVTCWAIADITRYTYYLIKNDGMIFVRYHLFFVLYPLGVYAEMKVINDYIKRHVSTLEISEISMIRYIQAAIVIGTVFLYLHMIKTRAKYFGNKKVQANTEQKAKAVKTQ